MKSKIVDYVSEKAGVSKAASKRAIDAFFESIENGLKKGDKITFSGFGTFYVVKRNARVARNPKTGKEVMVPAKNVVKFRVSKRLNEVVA